MLHSHDDDEKGITADGREMGYYTWPSSSRRNDSKNDGYTGSHFHAVIWHKETAAHLLPDHFLLLALELGGMAVAWALREGDMELLADSWSGISKMSDG
jgi:hypothetical protein